jgi:membrane protein
VIAHVNPKGFVIAAGAASSLVATRAVLPRLLGHVIGFALRKVPGLHGRVEHVEMHLLEGRISLRGLVVTRASDHQVDATVEVDRLTVNLDWKRLLTGDLVADVRLDNPRMVLDVGTVLGGGAARPAPHGPDWPGLAPVPWQQKIRDVLAFRVNVAATGGTLRLVDVPGLNGTHLDAAEVDLSVENLTNSARLSSTLLTKAVCRARIMSGGRLELHAKGYPLADEPTFDADIVLRGLDLVELGMVIRRHSGFAVKHGTLDAYVEAAAKDGKLQGYVKPVIQHLEVERSEPGLTAAMKQAGAKAATRLFEHEKDGRIATRIEFEGSVHRPEIDVLGAVGTFIRNAYLTPLVADLEDRLRFDRDGREARDVHVRYERPMKSGLRQTFEVIIDSARRWSEDQAARMGAALSYYTVFSIAPLLILIIAIAGLAFGRDAAQGRIMDEIGGLVGLQSAQAIQSMIKSASRPVHGIIATIISLIGLLGGASGVLSELKFALNKIFRTREVGGLRELVKQRLKLYGIVLGIGFVLTVSLAISAAVAAAGKFLGGLLPIPEFVMQVVNFVISFAVITGSFAMMYKFVPDVQLRWRDVWLGAGLTSFLFTVGKSLLGLYLGKGAVSSSYGAAGSVLIILLWVYYSALIFYFGAEFTKVYADRYGAKAVPAAPLTSPADTVEPPGPELRKAA